MVAHFSAPSLPPRVRRGVFNLVQSLVVAGEEDASAVGARDVLGDDVVRGAAVVEGVEGELVVQRRSLAAVAECASHEDNLHGGGHREDVVDGAEEDALFGLGEAHGDDGLLLAAVLHGHVVGPVQAPEEERVVHGGPGAIDLGQDAAEAHRLARRVPLQDDGRELARARRRNLGRPLRRNTNKRRDDGQCAVREPTDGENGSIAMLGRCGFGAPTGGILTPSCWKEYASRGVSLSSVTRSTPSLSVWRLVTRRAASCICSAAAVGVGGGSERVQ